MQAGAIAGAPPAPQPFSSCTAGLARLALVPFSPSSDRRPHLVLVPGSLSHQAHRPESRLFTPTSHRPTEPTSVASRHAHSPALLR